MKLTVPFRVYCLLFVTLMISIACKKERQTPVAPVKHEGPICTTVLDADKKFPIYNVSVMPIKNGAPYPNWMTFDYTDTSGKYCFDYDISIWEAADYWEFEKQGYVPNNGNHIRNMPSVIYMQKYGCAWIHIKNVEPKNTSDCIWVMNSGVSGLIGANVDTIVFSHLIDPRFCEIPFSVWSNWGTSSQTCIATNTVAYHLSSGYDTTSIEVLY